MIFFWGPLLQQKVVTTLRILKVIGVARGRLCCGEVVSQQQLGGVAAVKGCVALDRPIT